MERLANDRRGRHRRGSGRRADAPGYSGILAAYDPETGERVYQARLTPQGGGTFASSPVASDGKLYFASEDGDVIVVKAGRQFERLAINQMAEPIMASPAISPGMIIFRTQHHVVAVGETGSGR